MQTELNFDIKQTENSNVKMSYCKYNVFWAVAKLLSKQLVKIH